MIKTAARCKPLETKNSVNTVKPRVNHFLSKTWAFPCVFNKYRIYSDSDLIFPLRKCANTTHGCIFFTVLLTCTATLITYSKRVVITVLTTSFPTRIPAPKVSSFVVALVFLFVVYTLVNNIHKR